MKTTLSAAALLGSGLATLVLVSCGVLGGPPLDLQVAADTLGTNVIVAWNPPAEGPPDAYVVYYRSLGNGEFTTLTETPGVMYEHDPQGRTGAYKVAAKYGGDLYESDSLLSTVPVWTDTTLMFELDGAGNSGYGWQDSIASTGRTYSMLDTLNVDSVDFYITDFAVGSSGREYAIASPDVALLKDSSHVVPAGDWRVNWFSNPLPESLAQGPVPHLLYLLPDDTFYFDFTPRIIPGMLVGVCMPQPDTHYALVRVMGVNQANGEVLIESWYQRVARLRLMDHGTGQ